MPDQPIFRTAIVEADFLNRILIQTGGATFEAGQNIAAKRVNIPEEISNRFLGEQVDPYWHSETDRLEYFISYNDGSYFCQRKRVRYDFKTQSNYWSTYTFSGASAEQVEALTNKLTDFVAALSEYKAAKYDTILQSIDQEFIFYDQRWLKKFREKQMMLSASDWRVLPDIEDSYPGEKDMWIKWRATMRSETVKKPEEFETNLEFLKYLYEHKWPVDPKRYQQMYPNADVEYLSTDDQWVSYDTEASTDFVDSRLVNVLATSGVYREKIVDINRKVYNLIKDLRLEDFAEINYDQYNITE
jgi:hypothetical protein